ncbi:MAG: hypothetical protein DF168_00585 [Candidatus Moanabacter tarae]|uniref:Uncharacterized protein n=1 Tax=Candidatus Moanibacter tarae TaxID=2200854 RepID=A0A2Z4AHB6_9BACT|nr:MAG: hypothetical protein DF168_00585 [Candidatus Moanabacter tarae]
MEECDKDNPVDSNYSLLGAGLGYVMSYDMVHVALQYTDTFY